MSVVKTLFVDQTRTLTGIKTLIVDQTRTLTDISSNLDNQLRETTLELDSHADTCVLGRDALILLNFNRPVTVQGYDPAQGTAKYDVVSGVVSYTDSTTGEEYHLVINQAIHIPHLDHHLLCPMQCRVNDVRVNETPRFLEEDPTDNTHALIIADPDDPLQTITLRLALRGVTSLLYVKNVSIDEWLADNRKRLHLTSETLTWDPNTTRYEEQELAAVTNNFGGLVPHDSSPQFVISISTLSSLTTDQVDITDDDNFHTVLESHIMISSIDSRLAGQLRTRRTSPIDPLTLAGRWMISPAQAEQTIRNTTQRCVRTCMNPTLARRFPTNDRMLRYKRLPHPVFTDTLIAGTISRQGNKVAQVYATPFGWSRCHPMQRKGDAHQTLSLLFQRDGVPPTMIVDNSKEQTQGDFRRKLREADCHLKQTEPYSPWMQACEGCIRELKRGSSRQMIRTGSPKCLWDHCIELQAYIRSCTSNGIYMTAGQTPETIMSGSTADISNICEFAWFDWVMFRDNVPTYPDDKLILGRYLGPATDVGSAMTMKILKQNGQVVYRSTVRHLTNEELGDEVHTKSRREFDQAIAESHGPAATVEDFPVEDLTPEYEDFDPGEINIGSADDDLELEDTEMITPETGDNLINAEVQIARGGILTKGRVVARKRDIHGNPIGRVNDNPILDTRQYVVQFSDGDETELNANMIAEAIYAQCDPDGNQYVLLEALVDHRSNDKAVKLSDQNTVTADGKSYQRKSTAGWQICCQWKDGSTSWENLHKLKESHPVETAEYAMTMGIDHEPAFNWWVPYVIKKRERIISLVKKRQTRYLKRTHKFGIAVPKSVDEALELDKINGNTLWADAIAKEMKNVRAAFKILPDGERAPNGYQRIHCHMIFDVKMENFQRKARLVAGGHQTNAPDTITYASVVSRETVRIALTYAALNDLQVKVGDVLNAYITAPITEKVWTVLGPEFGQDAGKKAIIVRALYGLKSAGAAFRAHLASFMRTMGYKSCKADPDLWLKEETRPSDNVRYYSYILCYVDDILVINHDSMSVLGRINEYLPLKPTSVGDPDVYLGAKLRNVRLDNGVYAWALSPSKYVSQAVANCVAHLDKNFDGKYKLPVKAENPFPTTYDPTSDTSEALDPEQASFFMHLIGCMRWMIEIGRVDIATEVSLLSSYLAYPREGHLEAALHIMGYLKQKHNTRLVFDPTIPDINLSQFPKYDWTEFYGDIKEALPPDMPEPLGKEIDLRMMVDSDHAGDKATRRSRSGILIFMNNALIDWLSKRQPTIETSVFGAEFVAMKLGIERLRGIRYKLRMMGIPITGPSYIYGDNKSAITNSTTPESTLAKKNNAICYHAIRESVASGESLLTHIPTVDNLADLMTKVTFGAKRRRLVSKILYDIFDEHYL